MRLLILLLLHLIMPVRLYNKSIHQPESRIPQQSLSLSLSQTHRKRKRKEKEKERKKENTKEEGRRTPKRNSHMRHDRLPRGPMPMHLPGRDMHDIPDPQTLGRLTLRADQPGTHGDGQDLSRSEKVKGVSRCLRQSRRLLDIDTLFRGNASEFERRA